MEGGLAAGQPARERLARGEVALDELTAELPQAFRLPGRAHERDHLVAALAQPLSEPAAEKARAPGDERLHEVRDAAAAGWPYS
jgi:hypothetical protein